MTYVRQVAVLSVLLASGSSFVYIWTGFLSLWLCLLGIAACINMLIVYMNDRSYASVRILREENEQLRKDMHAATLRIAELESR